MENLTTENVSGIRTSSPPPPPSPLFVCLRHHRDTAICEVGWRAFVRDTAATLPSAKPVWAHLAATPLRHCHLRSRLARVCPRHRCDTAICEVGLRVFGRDTAATLQVSKSACACLAATPLRHYNLRSRLAGVFQRHRCDTAICMITLREKALKLYDPNVSCLWIFPPPPSPSFPPRTDVFFPSSCATP